MFKIICRRIGCIMIGVALAFVAYALNHPEASFPWTNSVSYIIYATYILITVGLLILSRK